MYDNYHCMSDVDRREFPTTGPPSTDWINGYDTGNEVGLLLGFRRGLETGFFYGSLITLALGTVIYTIYRSYHG